MPENESNQSAESYEALKKRNQVLEEQLSAQEDMLSRTTAYLEELQQKLKESNEQLEAYNETLEAKVKARTEELEEKNVALAEENRSKATYQSRLEKANYELNTLMYRASHDLRGPLTNALGLIELIGQEVNENNDTIAYLKDTLNEMVSIVDSIHNIIYYQNLAENNQYLEVKPVLTQIFSKAEGETGIAEGELEIIHHGIREIATLPDSFQMIFFQLFKNGLKYANDSGTPYLRVEISEQEQSWQFHVADNGPGMDSQIESSIFDMFTRGQGKTGKGLGLFQAKTLIEKTGGTINLQKNTAEGTTFAVTIPKQKE